MYCSADKNIIRCPFQSSNTPECLNNQVGCCFQKKDISPVAKKVYERKERWYEKFYK